MAGNSLLNRTIDTLRGGVGQATRAGRGAATQGVALGKRVANRNPAAKEGMDDVTLTRKVETEIFRPADAPKGKVDVNAVDGVVWLRGEVKNQAASKSLETKVRSIPEVSDVENLLHLPNTPAPSRTRAGTRKKTTTGKKSEPRQATKTAEKPKSSAKEPRPKEAAKARTGRKAAPFGSLDTDAPSTTSADSLTGGTAPKPADAGGSGSAAS